MIRFSFKPRSFKSLLKNWLFSPKGIRYILAILLIAFYFCLPSPLFEVPYSTVITDRHQHLLGAHIANDGQWRFPMPDSVPNRYEQCLLTFEDEYFYYHPGVNPFSLLRAAFQNIGSGKIISGGSTITMQTIRLSRPLSRNIWNKIIEIIQSIRLEVKYSKKDILKFYAAHAPYGANVVGLETASWRYFGRPSSNLSWAEAATLAVLPNSPGLIHPGRNRHQLKSKRDRLLKRLYENQIIDEFEYQLSVEEPVVESPSPLPRIAPHVLSAMMKQHPGTIQQTSLDEQLQQQAVNIVERHSRHLQLNQIHNAAALIIDNRTSKVLAYVGNTSQNAKTENQGNEVDIVQSPRSTGSILKPILYAASLNDGLIWPHQLIKDIPTYYSDFSPQNYHKNYDGMVRADMALSRSLNIPFVRLLNDYGTDRFLQILIKSGCTTFNKSADHYGLSLILGGGEATLWDLAGAYSSMARVVDNFVPYQSQYNPEDLHKPILFKQDTLYQKMKLTDRPHWLSVSSIWFTLECLTKLNRPEEETGWESFASSQKIAWKTGTSFGFRDAWAIGVTPEYTVAVWVGNATGEGRPGITGGAAAAPIMFDLFRLLPMTSWFETPYDDLNQSPVCHSSGLPAGAECEPIDTIWIPKARNAPSACPYHHTIHLNKENQYRVTSACYSPSEMINKKWFVLPPLCEWYYRNKSPEYAMLPPLMQGCIDETLNPMEFIYPTQNISVFIPKNIEGSTEEVVIRLAHRHPESKIYWYVDSDYLGETSQFHQMGIKLTNGKHIITCTDEAGNRLTRQIKCVNKD